MATTREYKIDMQLGTAIATFQAEEVREVRSGGRTFLVAPAVLMVEGVRNGALIDFADLQRSVPGWNGRPVVIDHPMDSAGRPISANSLEVLEARGVGQLFAVSADEDLRALVGEIWAETPRLARHDQDLVTRMRGRGDTIENSIAYWHETEQERGTFNGQRYTERHTFLLPDHHALLPESTGACSVDDGCGVPRANQHRPGSQMTLSTRSKETNMKTHVSMSDLSDTLGKQLAELHNNAAIDLVDVELDDAVAIYRVHGEDRVKEFRQPFTRNGDTIQLDGEPQAGRIKVVFEFEGQEEQEPEPEPEPEPAAQAEQTSETPAAAGECGCDPAVQEAIEYAERARKRLTQHLVDAGMREQDVATMPLSTMEHVASVLAAAEKKVTADAEHVQAERTNGAAHAGRPTPATERKPYTPPRALVPRSERGF